MEKSCHGKKCKLNNYTKPETILDLEIERNEIDLVSESRMIDAPTVIESINYHALGDYNR